MVREGFGRVAGVIGNRHGDDQVDHATQLFENGTSLLVRQHSQHQRGHSLHAPSRHGPRDRCRRRRVMRTIEPTPGHGRQDRSERAGRQQLHPRGPLRVGRSPLHRLFGDQDRLLMPQHCDGQRQIARLVSARQARSGQGQLSLLVFIGHGTPGANARPGLPSCKDRRARRRRDLGNRLAQGARIIHGDEGRTPLCDPRLFARDARQFAPEKRLMVDAQRGDATDGGRRQDIGRIEAPAQAHFDNRGRSRGTSKAQERCGGRHLEKACADPLGMDQHFLEHRRQRLVLDQAAVQPYPLVEADEVGAGIDMNALPGCLDRRAQKGAGRSLAIGSCDVKHRWQMMLRIAQSREQGGDPLQPQYVRAR